MLNDFLHNYYNSFVTLNTHDGFTLHTHNY